MNLNLYGINSKIELVLDNAVDQETGEIIDEQLMEQLGALELEKNEIIENVLLEIKNQNAYAKALKEEKQEIDKKKARAEQRAETLKKYVSQALNGEKFKTPKVSVSYRNTKSTEYTGDIENLPSSCVKVEKSIYKTELKKLLESGADIPGATIVTNTSMIIK